MVGSVVKPRRGCWGTAMYASYRCSNCGVPASDHMLQIAGTCAAPTTPTTLAPFADSAVSHSRLEQTQIFTYWPIDFKSVDLPLCSLGLVEFMQLAPLQVGVMIKTRGDQQQTNHGRLALWPLRAQLVIQITRLSCQR